MNTKFYPAENYYKTLERLERSLKSGKFTGYTQQKKRQIWNRLCRYARQLGITIKSSVVTACIAAGLSFASPVSGQTFTQETGANNPLNGVTVGTESAPTFVDIDGDGDQDAFIGQYDGTIAYYKNTGTATAPVFTLETGANNPLNGIDVGYGSYPVFVDIDGDGDKDVFIGSYYGTITYYKNTGTATAPVFTLQSGPANPFNGLDVGFYSLPSFVDIDGDGDFDAFIGGPTNILYYKNTGTATAPVFTLQTGSNDPFDGAGFNSYAVPAFADLDGDGDYDAVIGSSGGTFYYEKNTGTASAPVFTLITGSADPFNGFNPPGYTTPYFVDIDGDGKADLFAGDTDGDIFYFHNTSGNLPLRLTGFSGISENGYNKLQWKTASEMDTKSFELQRSVDGANFTSIAKVQAAGSSSENNYSYNDIGIYNGKLFYRLKMTDIDGRFTYSQVIWINNNDTRGIVIYPNPAKDFININMGNAPVIKIKAGVYDAQGKLIQNILISENQLQINLSGFAKGKYVIKFADGSVRSFIKN